MRKEGIDYEETFTPIARYTSIRLLLSLVVVMKWKIHQMDVKKSFLNGVVEEEVYVLQPLGFETLDKETHVCKLNKSLYDLKQAPMAWYVQKPLSFETHDRESHVCILKKSLYYLKQAPRTWYGRIDSFLSILGFTKSKADSNLHYKVEGGRPMILLLYVDNLFLTGENKLIADAKRRLATKFEMKYLVMMLLEYRYNLHMV